jgi:hypothetical protein
VGNTKGKKVKLSLCLTNEASRPCRFTSGERAPGTHWIGGWVGPRAGLDDVEKRKSLTVLGLELRPLGRPARSQSFHRLRYPGSNTKRTLCQNSWCLGRDSNWNISEYKSVALPLQQPVRWRWSEWVPCWSLFTVLHGLPHFPTTVTFQTKHTRTFWEVGICKFKPPSVMIVCILAEIGTRYLLNTNRKL